VIIIFLQEFLHVCIVKFFSSVGLQIFRASSIVLNYYCNRYNYVISAFGLEWYSPCMLAQHIDNVMIISVESRVRSHVDQIRLPQVITSGTMTHLRRKFFLAGVCSSITSRLSECFFSDIMICDTIIFIYSRHLLNLLKLIYHNLYVILQRCNLFSDFVLSIFQNFHAL